MASFVFDNLNVSSRGTPLRWCWPHSLSDRNQLGVARWLSTRTKIKRGRHRFLTTHLQYLSKRWTGRHAFPLECPLTRLNKACHSLIHARLYSRDHYHFDYSQRRSSRLLWRSRKGHVGVRLSLHVTRALPVVSIFRWHPRRANP